jgi:putative spermidine/putrescine transport system permease protein
MGFSLRLAALTALISAAIGAPLAFALVRRRFRGKALVEALVVGPLVLPTNVSGIALLQFLHTLGFGALVGFWGLLIGHVVIAPPFCVRTVAVSLRAMPPQPEAAAASLGAPPVTVAILAFLEFGFAPTLAAVSMLSLVIPLALVALLERFVPIGDFLYAALGRR